MPQLASGELRASYASRFPVFFDARELERLLENLIWLRPRNEGGVTFDDGEDSRGGILRFGNCMLNESRGGMSTEGRKANRVRS